MEFVGDAYKLKQTAKHSAALQALNYLDSWRRMHLIAFALTLSRLLHSRELLEARAASGTAKPGEDSNSNFEGQL